MVATAQISDPVKYLVGEENIVPPRVSWQSLTHEQQLAVVEQLLAVVNKSKHWARTTGFKPLYEWLEQHLKPHVIDPARIGMSGPREFSSRRHCLMLMTLPIRYDNPVWTKERVEFDRLLLIDRVGRLVRLEIGYSIESLNRSRREVRQPVAWSNCWVEPDELAVLVSDQGLALIEALDSSLADAAAYWKAQAERSESLREELFTRFYERLK